MGRRGPVPQPAENLKLNGSWRAKHRGNPPVPDLPPPRCPAWLSREAKAEWRRLAPTLMKWGFLTALDISALACFCEAFATWRAATETLRKEGETYKAGDLVKRHPACAIASNAAKDLMAFAREFGLTPASRQRLPVVPAQKVDSGGSVITRIRNAHDDDEQELERILNNDDEAEQA